jgi:hypothetical protein
MDDDRKRNAFYFDLKDNTGGLLEATAPVWNSSNMYNIQNQVLLS